MLSVKAFCRTVAGAGALSLAVVATSGAASAQTANDYNRAAAAMQICASPAGASIPQCAQLNQQLGGGGGTANAGAGAAAAGALLNSLAGSRGGSGGGGGLMGLLGAVAGQAAQASAPAAPVGSGDYYNQAATATHNAGLSYQACVAANPSNWQPCLAHMNGGVPVNVPGAAAPAAVPGLNLTGAALAGYQRCLEVNPADKCAQAYGAMATAPAAPPANGANAIANAAAAAQTAKQLAPTIRALGSLLGR